MDHGHAHGPRSGHSHTPVSSHPRTRPPEGSLSICEQRSLAVHSKVIHTSDSWSHTSTELLQTYRLSGERTESAEVPSLPHAHRHRIAISCPRPRSTPMVQYVQHALKYRYGVTQPPKLRSCAPGSRARINGQRTTTNPAQRMQLSVASVYGATHHLLHAVGRPPAQASCSAGAVRRRLPSTASCTLVSMPSYRRKVRASAGSRVERSVETNSGTPDSGWTVPPT